MRRCISGILLAAVCSLIFAARPAYPLIAEKIRLTMPVVALSMMPVYVAKAGGYFAQEGLDVVRLVVDRHDDRNERPLLLRWRHECDSPGAAPLAA